jgi:poly-D-alanine transfer protein DltD
MKEVLEIFYLSSGTNESIEVLKVSETIHLKWKMWLYALATFMKNSSKLETTIF